MDKEEYFYTPPLKLLKFVLSCKDISRQFNNIILFERTLDGDKLLTTHYEDWREFSYDDYVVESWETSGKALIITVIGAYTYNRYNAL